MRLFLYRYPQCYWKGDVRRNFLRKKNAFTGAKNLTITTPSQWLADQVSKSFLQNYPRTVIPNGIDRTIFRPQSSSLREKYHLVPFFKIPVKDQLFCFHLVVFSLSAYPAVFNRLVISQNLHVRGLFPKSPQRVLHGACDKEKEEEFLKRPGVIKTMQDFSFAKEL